MCIVLKFYDIQINLERYTFNESISQACFKEVPEQQELSLVDLLSDPLLILYLR